MRASSASSGGLAAAIFSAHTVPAAGQPSPVVDAFRIARELSEKRLEAEMKKLKVGMTTNYFVLQYQNDLANKRSQELRALVDYNVAVANIAKVTGTNLENRNITF